MISPRRYQIDAVNSVIAHLKIKDGNPLVVAATGTGKSVIIASLIERLKKANSIKILVCTHVAELVDQNAKKLKAIMPHADIGIYSAGLGLKQSGHDVTFAGIQSFARAGEIPHFDLLIVDEVHSISRKSESQWGSFIARLKEKKPNLRIVGFTATDFRLDSGSLTSGDGALFEEVCYEYGLGRAIQEGYLCRLSTKSTATKYDISSVGKQAGEFKQSDLEMATNLDYLNKQAVEEMIAKASDRKSWLIFCNGVKHSFAIRDELRLRGIVAETVTGETPDYERDSILRDFKAGKIRAVTNNAVWTTGIDVPNIDMIGMLRHTMSSGLLLQMAGRGTRVTVDLSPYTTSQERRQAIAQSSKPNCLFLDYAGNIKRHGFLDEIKAKDKKKKGDGVAPMKDCPECFSILHAAARKCSDCGYIFPVNEEEKLEKLHTGAALSEPAEKDVTDILYLPHNMNKEGRTPTLRVKYLHPDGTSTSEWVCLQHNGFAKAKALKWWNERGGCILTEDTTIEQIIDFKVCENLKRPTKITTRQEGKYERVVGYSFDAIPERAETAHFDISF